MSAEFNQIKESLVDNILDQGQRLRNAMVQSILKHDPLCSDIIYNKNKTYNTPASSSNTLIHKPTEDKKLLEAFLSGDYLTKDQEEIALNTVRSMPVTDVCEATERTILSKCSCATCTAYYMNSLKCDLRRSPNCNKKYASNKLSTYQEENNFDCAHVLKQVDSIKVILQSIHLNTLGNKKVSQSLNKREFSSVLNETYFVEYYIPDIFTKEIPRSIAKTDSGLESNHVRVCARRTSNVVHIRQVNLHSVCNLYDCNLEDHDITFLIRYKSIGQKNAELLGTAKFNLGLFKNAKNASCGKTLPIYLNEESSITVGTIKVTIQLGAGKLFFGQEFLDAVLSRKSSQDTGNSDSEELENIVPNYRNISSKELEFIGNSIKKDPKFEKSRNTNTKISPVLQPKVTHSSYFKQHKIEEEEVKVKPILENKKPIQILTQEVEGDILFGFLYISEAQFLNASPNSYILCQPYCQNDSSVSRIVYNNANPLYNFCQTVPLVYEDSLLLKLRENVMLIEFWNKSGEADELFGLTRLPLHQFYLGYRNTIILNHLKRNKLPIIGTDWWEPIYSADNNELIGQVQVLTALGTEDQIRNLELERGFKDDKVEAKFPSVTRPTKKDEDAKQPFSYFGDRAKVNRKASKLINIRTLVSTNQPVVTLGERGEKLTHQKPQKFDVGVQSDIDAPMDIKENSAKPPQTQDMLSSFLKILEQTQRPPCVENSTNTETTADSETSPQVPNVDISQAPQLRRTSELLDSLQKALSLDSRPPKRVEMPPHFKALINIHSANQLPCRRKIKSKTKRIKGRSPKQEENVLPSTYVTFETMPGESLQMTSVCPKSTSPQWNYRCEVCLPIDLLTNGQKRLIFKVWKKCTNAILQPNTQTDLVLGFAAVDLSVLSVGLPNVQGWFNIIDFSGKCNGQINIHVNPLEKVEKLNVQTPKVADGINSDPSLLSLLVETDECDELLSRTLKRKFSELDEITQRLRLRLSEVVSEDSEGSNDDITDEFEQDINNISVEEDFDLINFEEEAKKLSINYGSQKTEQKDKISTSNMLAAESQPGTSQESEDANIQEQDGDKLKSITSDLLSEKQESGNTTESSTSRSLFTDRQLKEGKHRIDTLLEKLSLITADASQPFSNRYVSGCSVASNDANDVQDMFNNLEQQSRPNITAANSFDPVLFQQLYGGSMSNVSLLKLDPLISDVNSNPSGSNGILSSGSETSVITNFSECRPNPDGQGTSSNDKET